MNPFRLSSEAEKDIEAILDWTHSQFSEQIRLRYEQLLVQAILDIVADPHRAWSFDSGRFAKDPSEYRLLPLYACNHTLRPHRNTGYAAMRLLN